MNEIFRTQWTLEDGIKFLQELRSAVLTTGFTVALGGSLLYKGKSEKDIDVILFPMSTDKVDIDSLRKVLNEFGMIQKYNREQVTEGWRARGSADTKHVEVWSFNGKRVDLIFLK